MVMITFSGTRKKAKTLTRDTSTPKLLNGTNAMCFGYSNVPLKVYMEVAATGNHRLLAINPKASEEELMEAWESIVKHNGIKSNDSAGLESYKRESISYCKLLARFNYVRASLLLLVL